MNIQISSETLKHWEHRNVSGIFGLPFLYMRIILVIFKSLRSVLVTNDKLTKYTKGVIIKLIN